MNKTDLIALIAKEADITKTSAANALNAMLSAIEGSLKERKNVAIIGFGTFEVIKRAARKGRNPKTGEEIDIPESHAIKFKPGKGLKESVNN